MLAIWGQIELTAMAQEQAATVLMEPTHRYLEVEGLKLHYLDWGGDPGTRTFVLLDGGPPSYLKDVRGLIDSLGARVVLVGHSMGGVVAQWVAVTHPELLEALVIVDAPHGVPPLFRRLMWRWRRRSRGGVRPELRSAGDIIRKLDRNRVW